MPRETDALATPARTSERRNGATGIEGAALRGAAITRKLLALTRHDLARPHRFDAGRAIDEMQPLLRHLMPRSIELDFTPSEGVLFARFDRGEFDRMILSIVQCARCAAYGGRFPAAAATTSDPVS